MTLANSGLILELLFEIVMCPLSGPIAPGTECLRLIDLCIAYCLHLCPLLDCSMGGNSTSSLSILVICSAVGVDCPGTGGSKGKGGAAWESCLNLVSWVVTTGPAVKEDTLVAVGLMCSDLYPGPARCGILGILSFPIACSSLCMVSHRGWLSFCMKAIIRCSEAVSVSISGEHDIAILSS